MVNPGPNIVALDQEDHGLVAVVNGSDPRPFNPTTDVDDLPSGGGVLIADANAWAVRNPLSQAQYCWNDIDELDTFLRRLHQLGYQPRSVANAFAGRLYVRAGLEQADAVIALADHTHSRVADDATTGQLWCGTCNEHSPFDGGRTVRPSRRRGDRSFGERAKVVEDFLLLQNQLEYNSPFVHDAIAVVWEGVTRDQRKLLNLKKTLREAAGSPNRVAAIAVCTHDPWTGELRTYDGTPWRSRFIRRHVIGLNGEMCGTGPGAAGNPMRAVLRSLGRGRQPAVLNDLDRAVTAAIWELQHHGPLPAA